MKLLEKLKNTFFEEEEYIEEVEEKPVSVAKKVEPKKVEVKEENKEKISTNISDSKDDDIKPNFTDSELTSSNTKFHYFEDDDFKVEDLEPVKEEPKKLYGSDASDIYDSIYQNNSSNKPYTREKEPFHPTPIISPIYGILDKNYRKEEVIDKKDKINVASSYVSRKNVDLDSVRRKAYGEDIINDNNTKSEEENDNLLYDVTESGQTPVVDKVTIADAEEYFQDLGLEYNIDYKDSKYEKATGRRTEYHHEEEKEDNQEDDANLDDNLFDLIDSMYDGKDGEE